MRGAPTMRAHGVVPSVLRFCLHLSALRPVHQRRCLPAEQCAVTHYSRHRRARDRRRGRLRRPSLPHSCFSSSTRVRVDRQRTVLCQDIRNTENTAFVIMYVLYENMISAGVVVTTRVVSQLT
jgi:hypothetical protein